MTIRRNIAFCFLFMLIMGSTGCINASEEFAQQISELEQRVAELEQTNAELELLKSSLEQKISEYEYMLDNTDNPDIMRKIAEELLGLESPDEITITTDGK